MWDQLSKAHHGRMVYDLPMDVRINVRIRPLTHHDIPRVMAIAAESFARPPTEVGWKAELENTYAHYHVILNVAKRDPSANQGSIVGYMGYWLVANECQINRIAIAPEERGRGYAKILLHDVLERVRKDGATLATLEVRESNIVAQRLYHSFRFEVVGIRPKFYKDNREDALIMTLQFQN